MLAALRAEISTHTLARRVTAIIELIYWKRYISTHTLARRVTWGSIQNALRAYPFQPTPSHGG